MFYIFFFLTSEIYLLKLHYAAYYMKKKQNKFEIKIYFTNSKKCMTEIFFAQQDITFSKSDFYIAVNDDVIKIYRRFLPVAIYHNFRKV